MSGPTTALGPLVRPPARAFSAGSREPDNPPEFGRTKLLRTAGSGSGPHSVSFCHCDAFLRIARPRVLRSLIKTSEPI